MSKKIFVTIAKPTQTLFSGHAISLYVPGVMGDMQILPTHEPVITPVRQGKIKIKKENNEEEIFDVQSGILEYAKDSATLLIKD